MTSNLRALGLAFIAMLAIGVFAAAQASANQSGSKFTSNGALQHITAEDVGAPDVFTLSGSELTCNGETFTTEAKDPTASLEFTPNWINCKTEGAGFNNVTVTHNGCKLKFTVTTTIKTDEDTGNVEVVCAPGNKIEIHHYSTAHNHVTGISNCTNTVEPQLGEGTVTYTSLTNNNDVEAHGTVGVKAVTHGICSFGFTLNVESTYHFSDTVRATSGARIHVGIPTA